MPDPNITYPIHLGKLNKAIGDRVLTVKGDAFIQASRSDDTVTLRLLLEALRPYFKSSYPGTLVFCNLSKTAGSIGTSTTTSSWVYTATDINGTQLGTSLSPLSATRRNGAWGQATSGFGYFDTSGTFQLVQAFETIPTAVC